jgi:CubicO group peptidase (beta-lactamase class C family)
VRGVEGIAERVDRVAAETGFSGVVRVDRPGTAVLARAYGLAERRHAVPMTVDTRLQIASGGKGFTAAAVLSLVEDGTLALETTARSVLRDDLPLIADDVTVEHLLAHRSGIGDYLDEDSGDGLLPVSGHLLADTVDFLPILDGIPTAFPAGERFAYNNGGYVVLALIAERVARTPYHDLVRRRVLDPAGMARTGFLRSDELPGDAAEHYVEVDGDLRSNVFHLPVRGNGDGGVYSTAADLRRFWTALFDGRIARRDTVAAMVRPRSDAGAGRRYGLGFWVDDTGVTLNGADWGVSFLSTHDPESGRTYTVLANTRDGAWPVVAALDAAFAK